MRDRTFLLLCRMSCALVLLILVAACESATDGTQTSSEHPISPNGNDLIVSQTLFEVPAGFNHAVSDARSGYFMTGPDASVGRIDANLDVDWTDNTLHYVGAVRHVATLGPWSDAVIAVGAIDLDSDGSEDAGAVAFLDRTGVLIDTALVYSDTLAVKLNGVVAADTGDPAAFFVVGEVTRGTKRPFAARISIASVDSTISVLVDTTYIGTGMDGAAFTAVTAAEPQTNAIYVTRNGAGFADVLGISDTFEVAWIANFGGDNGQPALLRAIEYAAGNLYVVGEVEVDKGGFFARAGLVASASLAGDTNWVDTLSTGGMQDSFDAVAIVGSELYAVGRGAQVYVPPFNDNLGYALVASYEPMTGARLYARTLGRNDRWSGLRSFVVEGNAGFGLGFRQDPTTTVREAWIVEMMLPEE